MIIYFSGTGNTRYVAKSLANLLDEEVVPITEISADNLALSGKYLILSFPIYSWGVPPIMLNYIADLPESVIAEIKANDIPVLMVCTCGDEVAEAPEMFVTAWKKRGVDVKGMWSVIMPNNYVLLPGFDVDSDAVEQLKSDESEERLRVVADRILSKNWTIDVVRGGMMKLKSRVVYPLFKRWGINSKRWQVSQECVSCGRCVKACPVGNIKMIMGNPIWGTNCISCTACYHHCPSHAISYGKITERKGQYFCHLMPISKK